MNGWHVEFTKLKAWQAACDVAEDVYALTNTFPDREVYGMTSQLRRAAVSMSTNIAEGYARWHARDKSRFYEMARSSGEEVKSLLCLAMRLGFVSLDRLDPTMAKVDVACRLAHGMVTAARSWT